jgi:hypothetical protein
MAADREWLEALTAENTRRGHKGSVSAEYKGRTHFGRFVVEGKIISVSYGERERSAQLGNSPIDVLAKIMLLELAVKASTSPNDDPEDFV